MLNMVLCFPFRLGNRNNSSVNSINDFQEKFSNQGSDSRTLQYLKPKFLFESLSADFCFTLLHLNVGFPISWKAIINNCWNKRMRFYKVFEKTLKQS